jgi:hypothetical protein
MNKLVRTIAFGSVLASVSLAMAVAGGFNTSTIPRTICDWSGGRFGTNENVCVKRDCYYTKSCGTWLSPLVPCETVQLGEPEHVVHFYFGNPKFQSADTHVWRFDKASSIDAQATFKDGKLIALKCPRPL